MSQTGITSVTWRISWSNLYLSFWTVGESSRFHDRAPVSMWGYHEYCLLEKNNETLIILLFVCMFFLLSIFPTPIIKKQRQRGRGEGMNFCCMSFIQRDSIWETAIQITCWGWRIGPVWCYMETKFLANSVKSTLMSIGECFTKGKRKHALPFLVLKMSTSMNSRWFCGRQISHQAFKVEVMDLQISK